jgi:ankyrin repeat protein
MGELDIDTLLASCLPCLFPQAEPPIFKACERPDALEEVRRCVKRDASAVRARRKEDRSTPLHLAVMLVDSDLVRFFLSNGADVTAVDEEGRTAVHVAALSGNQEICLAVLDAAVAAGLSVDHATDKGYTPLFLACWRGHLELAQALRARGASENRADSQGKSMLVRAREWNQAKVVAWLEGLRAGTFKEGAAAGDEQTRALLDGMAGGSDSGREDGLASGVPGAGAVTDLQAGAEGPSLG